MQFAQQLIHYVCCVSSKERLTGWIAERQAKLKAEQDKAKKSGQSQQPAAVGMGYQPAFAMGTPNKPTGSEDTTTVGEITHANLVVSTKENSTLDEMRANFDLKEVGDESPIKRTNKSSVVSKTIDEMMEEDTVAAGTGGQPREQKNLNIQKLLKDENENSDHEAAVSEKHPTSVDEWQVLEEDKLDLRGELSSDGLNNVDDDEDDEDDFDDVPDEMDNLGDKLAATQSLKQAQMMHSPSRGNTLKQVAMIPKD